MASTKPMNMYMGVGVTAFPITPHVEKTVMQMSNINEVFLDMFSNKI